MAILHEILTWGYLFFYVYYLVIILDIVVSWTPLRRSAFYGFLERVTSPYTRLFEGKLIVGGFFDLGQLLGVILYQVILAFVGSVL